MAPRPYSEILARNIRAWRASRKIGQEQVAARMRNLGFDGWVRQTVGSTEKPSRRVTAEEIFGLALVLEVSIPTLLAAVSDDDEAVALKDGALSVESTNKLAQGLNDRSLRWDGDVPVFGPGKSAWMAGDPDAPDFVKAAWREDDS